MSMNPNVLRKMVRDDYLDARERLSLWIEAAEEALREEGRVHEDIYAMLFWSQTEFHRRRSYLKLNRSELELRGSQTLRAIESRNREKMPDRGF